MSYVTTDTLGGRDALEQADVVTQYIDITTPISLHPRDLYLVFGEKAFTIPILVQAAAQQASLRDILEDRVYMGSTQDDIHYQHMARDGYDQAKAADAWFEVFGNTLQEGDDLDPHSWLQRSLKAGVIDHLLWAVSLGKDVLEQYRWATGLSGYTTEFVHYADNVIGTYSPRGNPCVIGLSKAFRKPGDIPDWRDTTRKQRMETAKPYPLSRRGRTPRGKTLADKRRQASLAKKG